MSMELKKYIYVCKFANANGQFIDNKINKRS